MSEVSILDTAFFASLKCVGEVPRMPARTFRTLEHGINLLTQRVGFPLPGQPCGGTRTGRASITHQPACLSGRARLRKSGGEEDFLVVDSILHRLFIVDSSRIVAVGAVLSASTMSSLFERIKSAIPTGGLQIAPYKVLRQGQDYEERLYPPQTWVRTQIRHSSREECTYAMFWKLLNYISGHNERQLQIPMTAPVSVLVEPDEEVEASGVAPTRFTMAFYIPPPFDENPPRPDESDVLIEYRPEMRIFARTYGGFTNDRIDMEERSHLLASMTPEDKEMVPEQQKPTGAYYCAGYDPPLKLFFRRNEIWFPICKSDDVHIGP